MNAANTDGDTPLGMTISSIEAGRVKPVALRSTIAVLGARGASVPTTQEAVRSLAGKRTPPWSVPSSPFLAMEREQEAGVHKQRRVTAQVIPLAGGSQMPQEPGSDVPFYVPDEEAAAREGRTASATSIPYRTILEVRSGTTAPHATLSSAVLLEPPGRSAAAGSGGNGSCERPSPQSRVAVAAGAPDLAPAAPLPFLAHAAPLPFLTHAPRERPSAQSGEAREEGSRSHSPPGGAATVHASAQP